MGGFGATFDSSDQQVDRERLVSALTDAGVEIYRLEGDAILLAERIRMHLMDSGVAVELSDPTAVTMAVRCQRSDFAAESAEALYERVRAAVGSVASQAGFDERTARERIITNPMDDAEVLDVWYEVVYARRMPNPHADDSLMQAVTWALALPKCVSP